MPELYRGRGIARGIAEGEALVTGQPVSFFGSVNPESGRITEIGHELYGVSVSGKILVMPPTKGSTASTWIIARSAENGVAPAAIIVQKADIILIAGVIIGQIPTVDNFDFDPTVKFETGQILRVDGEGGTVEVVS